MSNLEAPVAPIPPSEPLPHRKIVRSWVSRFSGEKNTIYAIILMSIDIALFFLTLAGVVWFDFWLWKLISSLVCGFVIGRLFIIGHDACHQSLTEHRQLNKILGRIAFLPSVSPYSLWDIGHNVVHHGYTNLKGVDFVWAPASKEEYDAMSPARQFMERIYRSGWAPGLYYMIEIWWNRMMFPTKAYMGTQRKVFFWDGLLCSVFGLAWAAIMIALAVATDQSIALLLILGWALPLFFWFSMIGLVVYVHHTHTKVTWHDDKKEWAAAAPFVSTTVHLTFKMNFGALLHHIMEHTAHHVDMSIPLYQLKDAQHKLEEMLPERIVVQPFSWDWYKRTAAACKLYDFKNKVWTDFNGRPIQKHEL